MPQPQRDARQDAPLGPGQRNLVPALAVKHDHYQFSRNAGHVDHATKLQTLPEALKYVWEHYHSPTRYRIFGNDVDQKPLR